MTRPESYDELIRTEIRKMRPTKAYPYDPDFPYVVLNVFSDEGIARFRYESDAVGFAYEDPTMYVIDTTPKERPMTDQTTAELVEEARLWPRDGVNEGRLINSLADALEAAELERDNWKMSAEEAVRAEKRWKDRAVEAEKRAEFHADQEALLRDDIGNLEAERDSAMASYKDYMTLRRKAAELSAVVEKARAVIECESGWFRYRAGRVLDILATSPADALREVKADVWASGYNAGYSDRSTPGETFTRNPYKAREERA